jgi:type VI protein secretion system component Hcp
MHIDGVTGPSQIPGFVGWIPIQSISVTNSPPPRTDGGDGGSASGDPESHPADVTVCKAVDVASHVIAGLQRDGTVVGDVEIDFFRLASGEAPSFYNVLAVWTLEGAMITTDQYGGGSGVGVTECITFSATNIDKQYTPTENPSVGVTVH